MRQITAALLLLVPSLVCANEGHDRVLELSEAERAATFTKILDPADGCVVNRTFFQGMSKGDALWNVGCKNGKSFAVLVKGDATGSTQIID